MFWLILAGIYSCIFLAFVGIWFWGKKKKANWLKWFGGIPAIGMATLALFLILSFSWGIIRSKNPEWVFKETFKVVPPPTVSKIHSSFYNFADTGSVYIRFEAGQVDFEKLVSPNLTKKTADEMKTEMPMEIGGKIPEWWNFQIQSEWVYYLRVSPATNSTATRSFSNETEYFAYNPKTQTAYYHFIGID